MEAKHKFWLALAFTSAVAVGVNQWRFSKLGTHQQYCAAPLDAQRDRVGAHIENINFAGDDYVGFFEGPNGSENVMATLYNKGNIAEKVVLLRDGKKFTFKGGQVIPRDIVELLGPQSRDVGKYIINVYCRTGAMLDRMQLKNLMMVNPGKSASVTTPAVPSAFSPASE